MTLDLWQNINGFIDVATPIAVAIITVYGSKKLTAVKARVTALEKENAALRIENAALKKKVSELYDRLIQMGNRKGPGVF